jgi:hypothetical protein
MEDIELNKIRNTRKEWIEEQLKLLATVESMDKATRPTGILKNRYTCVYLPALRENLLLLLRKEESNKKLWEEKLDQLGYRELLEIVPLYPTNRLKIIQELLKLLEDDEHLNPHYRSLVEERLIQLLKYEELVAERGLVIDRMIHALCKNKELITHLDPQKKKAFAAEILQILREQEVISLSEPICLSEPDVSSL